MATRHMPDAAQAYHLLRMDLQMAQQQHQAFYVVWRLRLKALLFDSHFEIAELVNAVTGILWGLFTLNPYADTFGSAPSFRLLATYADEWVVGLIVFVGGAQALAAMLHGHREWRMGATLLGVTTWSMLGCLFFLANPAGLALALYTPLALLAFWALLRLGARRGIQWTP